jgi:subtilisin family serine protease
MRNMGILAGLLLFTLGLFAQSAAVITPNLRGMMETKGETETISAWIFFTDKGTNIDENLQQAEAALTPRAYQRRLRNRGAGNLVDSYDLPVNARYLREVTAHVEKIRQKSRWLNAVSVEIRKSAIKEAAQLPFVKKIDVVHKSKLRMPEVTEIPANLSKDGNDGIHSLNYGPSFAQNNQISVPQLHDLGYDGSGVLVAMLDAGFNNLQHEALTHLNILHTWDFVNGDSIVSDEPGQMGSGYHGTYTLSALAGFQENDLIGPAFGADFVLAKTENTDYERNIEEDHWVAGAEWADSLGADIISSSLGYLDFDPGQVSYTWQDMDGNTAVSTIGADIAASRGILVVNSAGNEGPASPPQNSIIAPSDGDSVMAIGAVSSSGNRASFSSMGPTADGRIKPDVMARGVSTSCASASNPTGYITANGTSLSCPLVAGAAALVLQANPTWTNMQILEALRNTADNASTPDNAYGWGIINAYDAALTVTGIAGEENTLPNKIELYPVYPNPFNPATTIRYRLPENSDISLTAYNLLGQAVTTLFKGSQNAGEHRLTWNAEGLPSGIYYIVLVAGQKQTVQKAVLMK